MVLVASGGGDDITAALRVCATAEDERLARGWLGTKGKMRGSCGCGGGSDGDERQEWRPSVRRRGRKRALRPHAWRPSTATETTQRRGRDGELTREAEGDGGDAGWTREGAELAERLWRVQAVASSS
jgi:hypothetical protein